MNNQTKQLIEQATTRINTAPSEATWGEYQRSWEEHVDPELLVQLVVAECIKVCKSQRDPSNLNYKPSERFADEISQHFGVRSK